MGAFWNLFRRVGIRRGDADDDAAPGTSTTAHIEVRVPNMVCEGCAEKIEGVLHALPGVTEVRPSVPQKRIRVRFDPSTIDPRQLKRALRTAGFTADETERG